MADAVELITDPPEITMKAAGDKFSLQLINTSAKKICFKVKSSNNKLFRIIPVFGIVDSGQGTPLEIERVAGPPKVDKLVVEYMYCEGSPPNAEAYFKVSASL
ncbi:unnamed protein product, partial [Mesorhabditis spiculigera]